MLPPSYGNWNSIFKRFDLWSKRGLWQQLYQRLITEPDLENLLLDSTILRAHACAAGAIRGQQTQALGRSRGGFSSKLHTLVDGLRTLLACVLTGSEVNDITQAETLVFDHASFAG